MLTDDRTGRVVVLPDLAENGQAAFGGAMAIAAIRLFLITKAPASVDTVRTFAL